EHGLGVRGGIEREEPAEGADVGQDARREGLAGEAADAADGLLARFDVDAGVAVGGHGKGRSQKKDRKIRVTGGANGPDSRRCDGRRAGGAGPDLTRAPPLRFSARAGTGTPPRRVGLVQEGGYARPAIIGGAGEG